MAVIEDDEDILELISAFFRPKGYNIEPYTDARTLLRAVEKQHVTHDVILSDLMLPHLSGIELTKRLRSHGSEVPVILVTADHSANTAIEAMEAGAYDFFVKPIHFPQLQVCVERTLHFNRLRLGLDPHALRPQASLRDPLYADSIVGHSPGLLRAVEMARKVADSTANVFIAGETGSGKEVIAKAVHNFSMRRRHPFVAINCSAIPENLLESELFGHAKGSFTGAIDKKIGLFEEAGEGTLFLDEIGDLSLPLQAKLLRTLQERRIKRIGENQYRNINARIISATHRDLRLEVREKRFREDLLFRLNVIPIQIPPLRQRREDILPLAEFFLKKFTILNGKKAEGFSEDAIDYLLKNSWVGNVRELENAIERAVVLSEGGVLESRDFLDTFDSIPNPTPMLAFAAPATSMAAKKESNEFYGLVDSGQESLVSLDELTNRYLLYALQKNSGAKDKTARDLGIDRKTLYRRIQEMNRRREMPPGLREEISGLTQ